MKRRVVAAVAIALAACGGGRGDPVTADQVELDEFSIAASTGVWATGRIRLTVDNVGERAHTLIISAADGDVVSATDVVSPSESVTFDVDLESGTYQLTCRIVVEGDDGRIFDHYEQGMRASITVEG